jgi:hypothetical protein
MTIEYAIEDIFTCPDCNGNRIEEVLVEAVVTTELVSIDKWGYMTYAEPDVGHGSVECLRCVDCDRVVDKDDLIESVGCTDPPENANSTNPEG